MNKITQVLLFLFSMIFAIFYTKNSNLFSLSFLQNYADINKEQVNEKASETLLIESSELKLYNGVIKPQLYLAIMGHIFDVTPASDKYGPGKTYNFFIGRDGSLNFINGKFNEEDASDKIDNLKGDELLSLEQWLHFYKKQYSEIGKLIGTYYDNYGQLSQYGKKITQLIEEAKKVKTDKEKSEKLHPPCNVEWSPDQGTRLWCTNKSGGVERTWVGFPRQLFEPGSSEPRCACIHQDHLSITSLKAYDNCEPKSTVCYIK